MNKTTYYTSEEFREILEEKLPCYLKNRQECIREMMEAYDMKYAPVYFRIIKNDFTPISWAINCSLRDYPVSSQDLDEIRKTIKWNGEPEIDE